LVFGWQVFYQNREISEGCLSFIVIVPSLGEIISHIDEGKQQREEAT